MTPFTNSTPEFFDECIYHCEENWLPVDGELDAEMDHYHDGVDIVLPLLIPTSYVACPCNPLYSMNDELEGVVV